MKKIEFPVLNVRMVPVSKIVANDYNPNRMASPEMQLLKISIEQDGYTQPIVTYYDPERDVYEVVDGFHRYLCNELYFHLPELPVTVIDKPIDQRIASTIRHNRARGTHQIVDMSHIVCKLMQRGWDDAQICKYLGMELDEVVRLKQISGLKEAFANHTFSRSWEEFERRLQDEEGKDDPEAERKDNPDGKKNQAGVVVFRPAHPAFVVKRSLYVTIIDAIPAGWLTTEDAILDFIGDVYGEQNVSIDSTLTKTMEEYQKGIEHPYWRIVSKRGLVQEWRFSYSLEQRRELLEKEGHILTMSRSGVSYKVEGYKDKLFDLRKLKDRMPSKKEACGSAGLP